MSFKYSRFNSFRSFYKNKVDNKYHLELCFAQIGSGKSTDIAKQCYKVLNSHSYTYVYSNVKINLPGVRYFDIHDFNNGGVHFPEDSIIFCDEVSLLYDSRSYKTFPKAVSNYLRLSRHYKNTFVFYSQFYDCDKVIRTLSSKLYYMRRFGVLSVKQRISKIIAVNTSTDDKGKADSQIVDTLRFDSILSKGALQFTLIPCWTSLFNSFEKDNFSESREISYSCFDE